MPITCPDGEKARYRFKKKKLSGGRKARLAFCGNKVVEISIFKNKKKIKEKRIKPKGWVQESARYSLARKGIRTSRKSKKAKAMTYFQYTKNKTTKELEKELDELQTDIQHGSFGVRDLRMEQAIINELDKRESEESDEWKRQHPRR